MRCEHIFLLGGKWRGTISLSAGPMYLSIHMLSMGHTMPCSQMAYERTGNAHFLLERNIVQFLQQAEYTGPSRTPLPSSQGCSHSTVLKLAVSGDLAPRALGLNLQCRGTWGLVSTRDGCFFSSASRRRHTCELRKAAPPLLLLSSHSSFHEGVGWHSGHSQSLRQVSIS